MVKRAAGMLLVAAAALGAQQHAAFSGAAALEFTRKAVAFGARPSGSEAIHKLQTYIRAELKPLHCEVSEDVFRASTPLGPIEMRNIIARFPGTSGRIVALTGHYDTKAIPGILFLGANDGGSSTGFLLEAARVIANLPHKNEIRVVFFDGEEAIAQWSETDGTYGSRHLASQWLSDGTTAKLKALINVDMIGDRNLDIVNDENSTASLRRLIWDTAGALGAGKYFLTAPGSLLDDHIPFVQDGATAADLIDFDYGPNNSWWHSDKDTMDKLSANSLGVVGKVVIETIRKLEP